MMDKTKERDFGIALSGGGHRASLFALGSLLYLVDSGMNWRVATVCSVSGGSITNAFVAQECDFGTVGRDKFDKVAASLAGRITTERIVSLSSPVVGFYMGLLSVLGIAIFWFILARLVGWPSLLRLWAAVLLILVFGLVLLARGTVVAWLLGRAFFVDERGHPSRLGSLRNQTVGQVLCATDLISAAPFYFLCGKEWNAYSPLYGFARAGAMKLRTAVRASAALPGWIPPKLLITACLDWEADPDPRSIPLGEGETLKLSNLERPPQFLFLADGGVWNNLGTQYFERDRAHDVLFPALKTGLKPSINA